MTTHNPGSLVRITRLYRNEAEALADPATVVLRVQSPVTGTVTTPTVTNDAATVGGFYASITPTEHGMWRYSWFATGDPQVVEQGSFYVRRLVVPAATP